MRRQECLLRRILRFEGVPEQQPAETEDHSSVFREEDAKLVARRPRSARSAWSLVDAHVPVLTGFRAFRF